MVSFHDWHYIPNSVWVNAQRVQSITACLYALMSRKNGKWCALWVSDKWWHKKELLKMIVICDNTKGLSLFICFFSCPSIPHPLNYPPMMDAKTNSINPWALLPLNIRSVVKVWSCLAFLFPTFMQCHFACK